VYKYKPEGLRRLCVADQIIWFYIDQEEKKGKDGNELAATAAYR
jgi:hypothetical protein